MSQLYRFSRQGTVQFADSTVQQFPLQRGQVYRSLLLHLTGAATVTAANNVPANLGRMEAWSLLKNIQIQVGSNVIRYFSGDELAVMNHFFMPGGPKPLREATFGDGATANPAFDRVLEIPFWSPRVARPDATLLDARVLAQLTLQIQWGTWTDINAQATGWTTQPTLEVWQRYVFAAPGDNQSLAGPFATWESNPIVTPYPAAVKGAQIQLNVGDVYRGFLMNTEVNGTDTPGILNEFRLQSGSTVYVDVTENMLREQFALMSGGDPYGPEGALSVSTKFNPDAWYFYDHCIAGLLSEGIDTLGFASIVLNNDLTGQANANLHVHPQLIVPVR
jgi:hypothetical protein